MLEYVDAAASEKLTLTGTASLAVVVKSESFSTARLPIAAVATTAALAEPSPTVDVPVVIGRPTSSVAL